MSRSLILMLSVLSALGSLGIHALVPALPAISVDLEATAGLVQLAISLYMVGLIIGQLFGGWSSDRFGRKRVLIAGSLLYVAGAIGCAAAPEIVTFLASRVIQGLGGACALVVSRAVVADISSDDKTASHLGQLALIGLLAPTLAPFLGGILVSAGGWRLIFMVLATLGALAAIWTLASMRETWSRDLSPNGDFFLPFSVLLSNWGFMRYAAANAAGTIGMFGFLAGSSFFLVDRFAFGATGTGTAFLAVALSVMAGTLCSGRLERRRRGKGLSVGSVVYATGGLLMLLAAFSIDHPAALIMPMMVTGAGAGLMGPSALAGALQTEPAYRGTASSLFGALQMAFGAAITAVVAAFYRPTIFSVAIPVAGAGLMMLLIVYGVRAPRQKAGGA